MKKDNKKYLLPIGFYDLIGAEATINHDSINILLKKFHDFGYNLIKTPLVEFEESLSGNDKLSEQSFKMTDIFSGKNLVVISDITTQITRLLDTKLQKMALPLRLCYASDVLKVKNSDLYADRQLTQAGIELIGADSFDANQEVIDVILEGLNNIKLPNLLIDFCLPKFLDSLLLDLKIKNSEKLKTAIEEKNITQIRKLGGKFSAILVNLALKIGDLDAISDELNKLPISQINLEKLNNLQKITKNIRLNHPELVVLVNIFGDSDFLYHEEIAFTIFEEGFSYPIARGGRYKIKGEIPAIGATIYINNLRKILVKVPKKIKKTILIQPGLKSDEIRAIQKQGYVTINSLESGKIDQKQLMKDADRLGCNFVYLNGKILAFKSPDL